MPQPTTPVQRITATARGARASTGIMASATGVLPADKYSFAVARTHGIFTAPLNLPTRLQSGRLSLTVEPNAAAPVRHQGTQSGVHALAPAPNYALPSPMSLGLSGYGGQQSQFGIPTVRGSLSVPTMPVIPMATRKQINAAPVAASRTSVSPPTTVTAYAPRPSMVNPNPTAPGPGI